MCTHSCILGQHDDGLSRRNTPPNQHWNKQLCLTAFTAILFRLRNADETNPTSTVKAVQAWNMTDLTQVSAVDRQRQPATLGQHSTASQLAPNVQRIYFWITIVASATANWLRCASNRLPTPLYASAWHAVTYYVQHQYNSDDWLIRIYFTKPQIPQPCLFPQQLPISPLNHGNSSTPRLGFQCPSTQHTLTKTPSIVATETPTASCQAVTSCNQHCVHKPTRCNTSYEWSVLFIIWLYMFRTITSPSSV